MHHVASIMENLLCFIMKDLDRDPVPEYERRKYGLMELTSVKLSDLAAAISNHQIRAEVIFSFVIYVDNFKVMSCHVFCLCGDFCLTSLFTFHFSFFIIFVLVCVLHFVISALMQNIVLLFCLFV